MCIRDRSYTALPARGMEGPSEPRAQGAAYGVTNPGFAAPGGEVGTEISSIQASKTAAAVVSTSALAAVKVAMTPSGSAPDSMAKRRPPPSASQPERRAGVTSGWG